MLNSVLQTTKLTKAFSLVEVMVSMAIMILIGGTIITSQVNFNRATSFDEVVSEIVLTIRDQQHQAVNVSPSDPSSPYSFYYGRGFNLQNFSAVPGEDQETLVLFYDTDQEGDADGPELRQAAEFGLISFPFENTGYDVTRVYLVGSGILDGDSCYVDEFSDEDFNLVFTYLRPFSDPIMRATFGFARVTIGSTRDEVRDEGRRLSKAVIEISDTNND